MLHVKRFALVGTALAAIIASTAAASAKTLNVVASFTVLADVVREVGGENVHVKSLVGPNGDPHEFEPSPDDAKALKQSDVVFVSGEGLEGWMDRLITASGYAGTPVIASNGIKTREMEEDGKTITDPHVWNSPVNVEIWVNNIEKALAAADPDDAAHFRANAENFRKKLVQLDKYAHSKFDPVPEAKRHVMTSHDAFGYFGREYKIKFLSPIGLSTDAEPSAADVAKLIDQIKREHIKAVFIENATDPRLVQQVAKAAGAQMGGELYAEALSTADGPASTYMKMFQYNISSLVAGMKQN